MPDSVERWKNDLFRKIQNLIDRGRLEEALVLMRCVARMEYHYNQTFCDDVLEDYLGRVAREIQTRQSLSISKARRNTVLFYDGVGFNTRGLALIYVEALSREFDVVYVTEDSNKKRIVKIREAIEKNGGTIRYLKEQSNAGRIRELVEVIEESGAASLFLYVFAFDVVGTAAFLLYEGAARRFQINMGDHAFWLGKNSFDVCVEFRDYGAFLSRDYRGIDPEKLVILPYYPYFERGQTFEGYPFAFDEAKQKLIFSGGSVYKTIGPDGAYYQFVRRLLDSFPDAVFWYAGSGESADMEQLLRDYPGRTAWTSERRDLFQILQHATLYLDTYPLSGGLMLQYAAMSETVPIIVRKGNIAGADFWLAHEDEFCSEDFGQAFEWASEVFAMSAEEYDQCRVKLSEAVITPAEFQEELAKLVRGENTKYPVRFEPVDVEESRAVYQYRFDAAHLDRFFVNRESLILLKTMPFRFVREGLRKVLALRCGKKEARFLLSN